MLARVSHIEAFRQYRDWHPRFDGDEEPTIEETVAKIVSDQPTEAMRVGTAFHDALEKAADGEHEKLIAQGYTFDLEGGQIELPAIRELRVFKGYGDLRVTGKADCVLGRIIDDHKTTRQIDLERYMEGCSWRFYLDLFDADQFRWNLFLLKETDDRRTYRVAEPQRLSAYRYPELGDYCADLAAEYLDFARRYLPADFDALGSEREAA